MKELIDTRDSIYTEFCYAKSYRPWVNSCIFLLVLVPFCYLEAECLDL